MELKAYCLKLEVKIILEKLKEIKKKWDDELSMKYGGELEINYVDGNYFAYAFHNTPKVINDIEYDSWIERIKEFEALGKMSGLEEICNELGIAICH